MLAGFDACDEREQRLANELERELGFSPVLHAARLRDRKAGALRDIKRVIDVLIGDDLDREARCWTEPSLTLLRDRGNDTGLKAFLDELTTVFSALCAGRRSP